MATFDNRGLSLVEIVITLVVIAVGLGSLYSVVHRGLEHMRIVSAKNLALVVAESEIELVKTWSVQKLPETYSGPFLGEVDLSHLKDGSSTLKIEDYGPADGQLRIATATVQWTVCGQRKSVSLSTLVGIP